MLPPSELGTVFSLMETISATFPLILAPLASATYTAELEKEINVYTVEQKTNVVHFPISKYPFLVLDCQENQILALFQLLLLATLNKVLGDFWGIFGI